jgi:hypothetical protein
MNPDDISIRQTAHVVAERAIRMVDAPGHVDRPLAHLQPQRGLADEQVAAAPALVKPEVLAIRD